VQLTQPVVEEVPLPIATLDQLPERLAWFAEQREQAPVLWDDASGAWHLFQYDDVKRVLSDHPLFSSASDSSGAPGEAPEGIAASMIATDPPRHRQLRGLVSQAFTPKAIKQLQLRIDALAQELLGAAAPCGATELIRDFAAPLPVAVIAAMLGVSLARRDDFRRWSDQIVAVQPREVIDPERGPDWAVGEMTAYFREVLVERRREPGDDLISGLLAAEIDGRRLTEAELIGFCQLLLVAGNETTVNLIANAVICLDEHPAAAARLRREPELMPSAIEEVLRFMPPVWMPSPRRVRSDVALGGQRLREGAMVFPWLVSANRDERQFPDLNRFDITRKPNKHLTFGHGIHACLGAPLARLEAAIALPLLLDQLSDLQVVRDAPIPVVDSGVVFGPKVLPVTF